MSTISGRVTNGVALGQAGYSSPLTITAAGRVSTTTGVAVYAASTYANPVVLNQGTIIDAGDFDGVKLLDGGSITNTGTGSLIYGYTGIYIGGDTGTVTNSGTITASGAFVYGVVLGAAGSIDNTGLIQG